MVRQILEKLKHCYLLVTVFVLAFGLALLLQVKNGAYLSDLGGDPDEAAHAVTSLMVWDYLAQGIPSNPMAFAQSYYEYFPKVALGHYPPGFYVVGAVAVGLWRDISSLFVLEAFLAALLASLVYAYGRKWLGSVPSLFAGLLIVMLPVTQKLTSSVMSDLFLAICCLASVKAWSKFTLKPDVLTGLIFGVLASLAILTKGSGLMLAVVPPLMILMTGTYGLMRTKAFWIAPLPVLLLGVPWTLYSFHFVSEGFEEVGFKAFFSEALSFYGSATFDNIGVVASLLLVLGLFRLLGRLIRRRWLGPDEAGLWALLIANTLIIFLVPAGITSRYLLPAVAPALLIAMNEASFLAALLLRTLFKSLNWSEITVRNSACVITLMTSLIACFHLCPKGVTGFAAAYRIATLDGKQKTQSRNFLVSSDAKGEGAIIAAAAFSAIPISQEGPKILRGSKELSSSDWMGRGYKANFANTSELLAILDKRNIDWVFVDLTVPSYRKEEHHEQVQKALLSAPEKWDLAKVVSVRRGPTEMGELKVFHRKTVGSPSTNES